MDCPRQPSASGLNQRWELCRTPRPARAPTLLMQRRSRDKQAEQPRQPCLSCLWGGATLRHAVACCLQPGAATPHPAPRPPPFLGAGFDSFVGGQGRCAWRLWGALPAAAGEGPEVDQSLLVRWLAGARGGGACLPHHDSVPAGAACGRGRACGCCGPACRASQ